MTETCGKLRGSRMQCKSKPDSSKNDTTSPANPFAPAFEYFVDAAQRTILFWDVMRQRGNQFKAHQEETVPHVLEYAAELIIDGRNLERPVNYALARIIPPRDVKIDMRRRPFVVVD